MNIESNKKNCIKNGAIIEERDNRISELLVQLVICFCTFFLPFSEAFDLKCYEGDL